MQETVERRKGDLARARHGRHFPVGVPRACRGSCDRLAGCSSRRVRDNESPTLSVRALS